MDARRTSTARHRVMLAVARPMEPLVDRVPIRLLRRIRPRLLRGALLFVAERAALHRPRDFRTTGYAGITIRGNTADFLQRFVHVFGIWEPAITHFLVRRLNPGDVFVDVGANIGWYSLLARTCVGERGEVVAFEALPSTARKLEANVRENGLTVDVRNCAVGADGGATTVYRFAERNIARSGIYPDAEATAEDVVPMVRLDDALDPALIPRIRAIKIDVEGSEADVLAGAAAVLKGLSSGAVLVLEVTPDKNADRTEALLQSLRDLGFDLYRVFVSYRTIDYALADEKSHLELLTWTPTRQTDLVCIKN